MAFADGKFYLDDGAGSGSANTISTVVSRSAMTMAVAASLHDTSVGSPAAGANDYWFACFGFQLSGTVTAGTNNTFVLFNNASGSPKLKYKYATSSTFTIALNSAAELAVTTTTYSTGAWVDIRIVGDIAGDKTSVWINGVQEFTGVAQTLDTTAFLQLSASAASYTHYFSATALWSSSSLTDRPGTTIKAYAINPNGDDESATWGDDNVNCGDGAGTYTKWDDWVGGGSTDSGTTINVCCGGTSAYEMSTFESVAIDTSLTMSGLMFGMWGIPQTVSKSITTYHTLKDSNSGTKSEIAINFVSSASYFAMRNVWTSPPAGAWTDYVSSGTFNHASATRLLRAGVRNVNTSTTNPNVSAIGLELFFVNEDPPSASARRRVGPTLMSPGMFALSALSFFRSALRPMQNALAGIQLLKRECNCGNMIESPQRKGSHA